MFDEQVVRRDPEIAELLDRFVRVRLVQANALDLTLFQFDYDLTFTAFFLNADKVVYGRFGSRSEREDAQKDISIAGFRKALEGALELHRNYPANRSTLASKRKTEAGFKTPNDFPSLRGKYKPELDYDGKVVQSCLHCHQVREAERLYFRAERKPIPDEVLYPWPMPTVVGLALDPTERATVKDVVRDSAAEKAGFRAGDRILSIEGQPLLSIADVQWVLQNAGEPATLTALVNRGTDKLDLSLNLEKGWRRSTDISWRATTWDLRRLALGGLFLKELPPEKRADLKLPDNAMALFVEHAGEYGQHALAKKTGFRKGDVLTSIDGMSTHRTESEVLGYLLRNKQTGDRVPIKVLREGQTIEFQLPMQ